MALFVCAAGRSDEGGKCDYATTRGGTTWARGGEPATNRGGDPAALSLRDQWSLAFEDGDMSSEPGAIAAPHAAADTAAVLRLHAAGSCSADDEALLALFLRKNSQAFLFSKTRTTPTRLGSLPVW